MSIILSGNKSSVSLRSNPCITSITTDSEGNLYAELRYTAWGEVRYSSGQTPTDYTYTGQRSEVEEFGLMYYNARWYEPALGRFVEGDSIVLDLTVPLAFDRYSYVNNNPLRYNDPSGHRCFDVGNKTICNDEVDAHGDWRQKGKPQFSDYLKIRILAEWEIKLLIAAVMVDSSRGNFPIVFIEAMTWVYLNRITINTSRPGSPGWSEREFPMWEAVKGEAFYEWDAFFPLPECIARDGLQENEIDELESYLDNMKANYKYPNNWIYVEGIVRQAVNNWNMYEEDPTGGSTNFFHAFDVDFIDKLQALEKMKSVYPGFTYKYLGPSQVVGFDQLIYLFVNNLAVVRE